MRMHNSYWNLGDANKQRQFLNNLLEQQEVTSTRVGPHSRRSMTRSYFFLNDNNEKKRVCKTFFLNTLDISETPVKTVLNMRGAGNVLNDLQQGKGSQKNEFDRDIIRSHINSSPKVPSHYSRNNSNYEYLYGDVKKIAMYRLYKRYCEENNLPAAKKWMYSDVLENDFPFLRISKPRIDLCDSCCRYGNATAEGKVTLSSEQSAHVNRRRAAHEFHKNALKATTELKDINYIQVDLEAVRYCPQVVNSKSIFYKRRLAVYNLTIYNMQTRTAVCYMWHEGMAGRGSDEVGSCLYHYLVQHQNGKPFIIMSDTCGGQNRNINIAALLLLAVKTLDIPHIDQAFFEPGHSFMDVDKVHARIQISTKTMNIFTPDEWYEAVKGASIQGKYRVVQMGRDMGATFFNIKEFQKQMIRNKNTNTEGDTVKWLKCSWLGYRKNDEDHIYYKYDKSDEFKKISINKMKTRREITYNLTELQLGRAISKEKYKDMISLCNTGIISTIYHDFFVSLDHEE